LKNNGELETFDLNKKEQISKMLLEKPKDENFIGINTISNSSLEVFF